MSHPTDRHDPAARRPRPRARGLSLVEVMVATVLLTLSVTALAEGMLTSYRAEATSRRQSQAHALASDMLEILAAKPIDGGNGNGNGNGNANPNASPNANPGANAAGLPLSGLGQETAGEAQAENGLGQAVASLRASARANAGTTADRLEAAESYRDSLAALGTLDDADGHAGSVTLSSAESAEAYTYTVEVGNAIAGGREVTVRVEGPAGTTAELSRLVFSR